jgi:SAM-dependent methyltransferase
MSEIRDTDADWKAIGRADPYWGVLTNDALHRENITPASIDEFWASGERDIAAIFAFVEAHTAAPFAPKSVLDFGCGVGRLTRAISVRAERVVGYDISPGMLAEARKLKLADATFTTEMPDQEFDWVVSHIVFQHIPPARGYRIFDQLLQRIARVGVFSIQFTTFKEKKGFHYASGAWDGEQLRVYEDIPEPKGTLEMYDYDLSRIFSVAVKHGFGHLSLRHTDHGGCHGAIVIGSRTVAEQGRPEE